MKKNFLKTILFTALCSTFFSTTALAENPSNLTTKIIDGVEVLYENGSPYSGYFEKNGEYFSYVDGLLANGEYSIIEPYGDFVIGYVDGAWRNDCFENGKDYHGWMNSRYYNYGDLANTHLVHIDGVNYTFYKGNYFTGFDVYTYQSRDYASYTYYKDGLKYTGHLTITGEEIYIESFDPYEGEIPFKVGDICVLNEGEAVSGFFEEDGIEYWYENGLRQGTEGRGKEIYDWRTDAWYWLDAIDNGKKAVSKDVYQESQADDEGNIGKWVRYDENGHMIKGWNTNENGTYYFDLTYGTMAKGEKVINGVTYHFNQNTGTLEINDGWQTIDGVEYWYENNVRQGIQGRGKEIYDPVSDAWYWLDSIDNGKKATSKDVYQESQADDAGNIGKWVRYDENGHMIKGWDTNENGTYYFDLTYGTMAKGEKIIDGVVYKFNQDTGILE